MTDRRKKYENELPKKGLMRLVRIIPIKYEREITQRCTELRERHLREISGDVDADDGKTK